MKLKKKYIRAAKVVGVAGAAAIAAPILIPPVVSAFGFGATGTAAASVGATWMSWGAGYVPGFVSVCQSIGATGAISGATQALAGAIGGVVVTLVTRTSDEDKEMDENKTSEEEEEEREDGAAEKNENDVREETKAKDKTEGDQIAVFNDCFIMSKL